VVIRGRGSQFILKDYLGAIHLLLVAPLDLRVKRVMKSQKLDEENAKEEIERFDSSRREFTKRYFNAELGDSVYYDLIINTEYLSFNDAASIVIGALPFRDKTAEKRPKTGMQ
jgi:cytidylate kinase